ncbi:helix-turn-helix transcriptional regulator [Microtetraspora malaysiensis]|uniref:Helix-turn-helix transcriptional regulator n=1 Tax=Microtetraspora malaysiensis TaxID=161358 RepID=A0ABW6SKB1_9ACTN
MDATNITLSNTSIAYQAIQTMTSAYKTLYRAAVDSQPNPHAAWELNFIEQMRRLREARHMTQTDLAKILKSYGLPWHQQTVQKVENGERPVRLNEAYLIARTFGVDVMSMTESSAPSDRAIRYAVDQLRARSGTRASALNDTLGEWLTDVEAYAAALVERLPAHAETAADLDPVTRWGMAWAIKALTAIEASLEAWRDLTAIEGAATPAHLDNDPEILPGPGADVLSVLSDWRDRFGDDDTMRAAGTDPGDLYAQFPSEAT